MTHTIPRTKIAHKQASQNLTSRFATMTLLGVPTEATFSIGTSSTTAPASSGGPADMSLGKFIALQVRK